MINNFRFQEYKVLIYRVFLVYCFYGVARVLFTFFNFNLLKVDSVWQFLTLAYHGLAFDTTAILYLNGLFILLSVFPIRVSTSGYYQRVLFYVYFVCNLLGYATNFIDFIYYKYIYSRTTVAVLDIAKHETNKGNMFFRFIVSYWYVYVLFFILAVIWIKLYKCVVVKEEKRVHSVSYYGVSIVFLLLTATLCVGGIRGDFKKSTRPINMIDANRYVLKPQHADVVLNTPFAIIRTFNTTSFKKVDYEVEDSFLNATIRPIKKYNNNVQTRPNVMLFITESFGREYWGCMNKNTKIPNFKGYTPFLDSLATKSFIFTNAYANGSKSIHGMSSIIAGIPSFQDAFTSSPYPKQEIQSLVSCLKELGYDTSFFHGAPNGSMGFLGFGNILGYDHYYGKTEFNNDTEYDGAWGIWDEPFMQYVKKTLDTKKQPFFSTLFTLSSHEPYIVPGKYEGKFPKGTSPIHQCIGYTDYSFKRFFEAAKKEPWFKNTIFIITADHSNLTAFAEYEKPINRQAVPILIYTPQGNLIGENSSLAQQIDIYPTVLDMIGYKKPFRSWGRSLLGDKFIKPFVINYNGNLYQFQRGNYICTFDGKQVVGYYHSTDKALEHNLIAKPNKEMLENAKVCKAFLKDYYNRIIDRKLYSK